MKKTFFLIAFSFLFLLTFESVFSQTIIIKKGEEKLIKAENGHLFVITEKSAKNSIAAKDSLKITKEEIALLNKKVILLEESSDEKDDLIMKLKEKNESFQTQLIACEEHATIVEKEFDNVNRKAKIYKWTTIIGIPATLLIGIIIGL